MTLVLGAAFQAVAIAAALGAAPDPRRPVPDFSAVALDGTHVSLTEAVGSHRAVVVLFLSTVCPYANYFAEHIRELDETYRSRGVLFIGVNSNQFETTEEILAHVRERGHRFPIVRDEEARIADLLGAKRTPEAFLVDREGQLRYHGWVQSKLRSPDLQRALSAVLAGKAVRLTETKAFGCAIDRRRWD